MKTTGNDSWDRLVVFYTDGSPESQEALKLLEQHKNQVTLDIERGKPGRDEHYPTAVYQAWVYRGIEKIKILCDQLAFKQALQETVARFEGRKSPPPLMRRRSTLMLRARRILADVKSGK